MNGLRRATSLLGLCLLLALTLAPAAPAYAQDPTPPPEPPAFRINDWSIAPAALSRGIEFELTVTFTNVGGSVANNVQVSIGQNASFVGLDAGKYIADMDEGEQKTVHLRAAVSNQITTGHYSLPIQFDFQSESGTGVGLGDVKSVGVFVEGFNPPGQDEGLPSFTVTSWSVEPETLQRGQEFTVTATIQNVGTWGADEVVVEIGSGASFVGIAPSAPVPHVGIGESAAITVRGAVNNQIITGPYSLPLVINYHHSATGGQTLSDTESLGVQVQGIAPSLGPDTGRPQIVVEESTLQPAGEEGRVNLSLTLRNVGDRWATGVIVNLARSDLFNPAEGSSAIPVEQVLKLDETAAVTFPLTLMRSPGERTVQDFVIEYRSYSGGQYQTTQTVPVQFGEVSAEQPRLLVQGYSTEPEAVTPGARFTLSLNIRNVGGGPARQVFVRLGQGAQTLGPLAPVGSSNVQYIEQIGGGAQVDVKYDLVVDGEAEAGLVPVDLQLEYEDAFGVLRTETVTLSVQVVAAPFFQIGLFDALPEPIVVGDTFELPIEVINIGERQVNVSTVEVSADSRLRLTDSSLYIGPLDAGTSGTLVPEAEALQAGASTVTVRVNYLDSFQQPQTLERTIQVEIEPQSLEEDDEADGETGRGPLFGGGGAAGDEDLTPMQRFWRAVRGFFGIGTNRSNGNGESDGE